MIGIILGTFLCALITGAAGALAYGYRGQRDQEREQVEYLRKQLEQRPLSAVAQLPAPKKDEPKVWGAS